jgi:hypothetical protein
MARQRVLPSFLIGVAHPRHQYLNRLAASQSSQRWTLRKGQPPLLCTGSRHSAISQYTARRFLWYKMMAKPIITEFSERHPESVKEELSHLCFLKQFFDSLVRRQKENES